MSTPGYSYDNDLHSHNRRQFLSAVGGACAYGALGFPLLGLGGNKKPLNVLFITADDLHCESLGCYGGTLKDLTPNLDRLASQGMRFERAHVNIGICMPSRIAIATGQYGHNSGAMGFMHARNGTPDVVSTLSAAGYKTGVLGKVPHSSATINTAWDFVKVRNELGDGRNPDKYAQFTKSFIESAQQENQAFYLMVNAHDPHRPFQKPNAPKNGAAAPSKLYKPDEVAVPGFLPDLPGVREELSHYLNSVKRLDDTVGAVLKVLDASGAADNTLVMFISDNGIATPFAKCNCYLASTRTPWIARWPGVIKANSVNSDDFISGIDFLPTVLAATQQAALPKLDGQSFLPLLQGKQQTGREWLYTQIDSKAGNGYVPMRCVQNQRYGYIWNAWSNGKARYRNNNEGACMKAMNQAGKSNPQIQARVDLFRHRVHEELFDLKNDPDCLHNLIDDKKYKNIRQELATKMQDYMTSSNDSILDAFKHRYDDQKRQQYLAVAKQSGSNIKQKKSHLYAK